MTVRHVVFDFWPWGYPKACFKRRATAVLTWLDCSSTAAPHQRDLVSDVEFNSVAQNGCYRKQNAKIKKRFSKLLKVFLSIFNLSIEFGTAVVRRLKTSRATAVLHGPYGSSTTCFQTSRYTAVLKSNLIRLIQLGTAVARRLKRA